MTDASRAPLWSATARTAPSLRIGSPHDHAERAADVAADAVLRGSPVAVRGTSAGPVVRRACACGTCATCNQDETVRRSISGATPVGGDHAPPIVHEALRTSGAPLDAATRSFFERGYGSDLGSVRVHTGDLASRSATAIGANAYTVGNNIVFGAGQYAPTTQSGTRLLAHELAHVAQHRTAQDGPVRRAVAEPSPPDSALPQSTTAPITRWTRHPDARGVPRRRPCRKPATTSPPPPIVLTLDFAQGSAALTPAQRSDINAVSGSLADDVRIRTGEDRWLRQRRGRVPGATGPCRATEPRAVAAELSTPVITTAAAVPSSSVETFAAGESAGAGPILALNRRVTISIVPVPPRPPTCSLPHLIGKARGCASGADFGHFDFPPITSVSSAKLRAWALGMGSLSRGAVPNAACEASMDSALTFFGHGPGHAAYLNFVTGSGATMVHNNTSPLGLQALIDPRLAATVAAIRHVIRGPIGSLPRRRGRPSTPVGSPWCRQRPTSPASPPTWAP